MKIVIRVDASVQIGSGHVMRCLALAGGLKKQGHRVFFACIPQQGDMIKHIEHIGFSVILLQKNQGNLKGANANCRGSDNYFSWLGRSQQADADDFIQQINQIDWVIVDHYALNSEWELRVKNALMCHVLAIDDLNREHYCTCLVDQNIYSKPEQQYASSRLIKQYVGPQYALLRPHFSSLRSCPPKKKNQLLVFFGGSDPTGETEKFVNAMRYFSHISFNIKIVVGALNFSLMSSAVGLPASAEFCDFSIDFEKEMAMSHYMIGAGGSNSLERLCLKLPSSVVAVAENQIPIAKMLSRHQWARYLGCGAKTTVNDYINELTRLIRIWDTIVPLTSNDVDGEGVQRLVRELALLESEIRC